MYFYVSLTYSAVNAMLALIIFLKSRHNVLSKFYAFCVGLLAVLGAGGYLYDVHQPFVLQQIQQQVSAFVFAVFPFFFLHFMLIFIRRYEVLKSNLIIFTVYFAGLFSYVLTLLGLIPNPFLTKTGITLGGYIYYITWMSILFSVGVALLYSLIGGFREKGMKTNLLFTVFVMLMLLLPTPFTFSVFSLVSTESIALFTISSTTSLAIVVFFIFRHRITMNTPYQAMRAALAAMNDILIKADENWKIEMAQGATQSLLGYREEEMIGLKFTDVTRSNGALERHREDVLQSNKIKEGFFTLEVIPKIGEPLWMDFSITPVLANEEIVGFVGVGRNISARRKAEIALKESEARYRLLAENSTDLISIHTSDGVCVYASPASLALLGYEPRELVGQSIYRLVHPDDADGVRSSYAAIMDTRSVNTRSYRIRRKSGAYVWFETISRAIDDSSTVGIGEISSVSRDITERKEAEEALRESEERLRRLFEDDLTGVLTTTPGGKILSCNPAFARIFGFKSVEEAMRCNARELYPSLESRELLLGSLREKRKLELQEQEMRRIDGQPIFVVENIIGRFDEKDLLVEIKTYMFDNTEQKKLEGQLRHAQKLENLGSLAGGIAHDFNNILGILMGHADLLSLPSVSEARLATSVAAILQTVQRAQGLVRQLLTFARKTDVLFEPLSLNTVIPEFIKILTPTFPKTIVFCQELSPSLPSLSADANQLHQVLLNLCVNARDAMPNGGTISIRTGTLEGSLVRKKFMEARGDRYVCLSISDTGMGMDAQTRNRIFEPFFTTKEKGRGTGLGLAVVYGIVKSHHGFIDVESELGKGTTFHVYLEVAKRVDSVKEETAEKVLFNVSGHSILLVEDEEMLMEPVKFMLQDIGLQVLTAGDGQTALSAYERDWRKISAVLLDMGLPKMSGRDVYLKMKAINPRVKAIVASGHMDPELKLDLSGLGVKYFVEKPYKINEVIGVIQNALQ